jgi:hypothetical protein
MRLIGKSKLQKLKAKNIGNKPLCHEIDKLMHDIENNDWQNETENDGFYFFNIAVHRTMVLLEFEADGEATIVWTGTHQEYQRIFKNNKNTIAKWLRSKKYI